MQDNQALLFDGQPETSPNGHRSVPGSDTDPQFAEFWGTYPRKVAKKDARKAWAQQVKAGADPAVILAGAQVYAAARAADRRPGSADYTAYPASWLRGERWADEAVVPAGGHYRNPPSSDYRQPIRTRRTS